MSSTKDRAEADQKDEMIERWHTRALVELESLKHDREVFMFMSGVRKLSGTGGTGSGVVLRCRGGKEEAKHRVKALAEQEKMDARKKEREIEKRRRELTGTG